MSQKSFSHIAVRFPAPVRERLEARKNELKARTLTAVVRTELEGRLPRWQATRPILSQSHTAPRSELWLPKGLVSALRTEAETADANPSDLVVTLLADVGKPQGRKRASK